MIENANSLLEREPRQDGTLVVRSSTRSVIVGQRKKTQLSIQTRKIRTKPIRAAARAAERSSYKYRVGAAILKGARVLSYGHNKVKTHPNSTNQWKMIHAELDALYKLDPEQAVGATLCVVRLSAVGLASSKPCPSCWAAIEQAGVERLIYVDLDGQVIQCRMP